MGRRLGLVCFVACEERAAMQYASDWRVFGLGRDSGFSNSVRGIEPRLVRKHVAFDYPRSRRGIPKVLEFARSPKQPFGKSPSAHHGENLAYKGRA